MAEIHERLAAFLDRAYASETVLDAAGAPLELFPHSVERRAGEALRDLAMAEGAARTIEVGLALGISALFLSGGARPRRATPSHRPVSGGVVERRRPAHAA
jgi:predicted O-methyltransferase YrrM